MADPKHRSRDVTEGYERAPARAMLRAIGMTDEDWGKPQVGDRLVVERGHALQPAPRPAGQAGQGGGPRGGGLPDRVRTIAVSDGISMGHEGMRASLVSREVIADSVETVMHAERLDGMVTFAGCDKSLPGMVMAAVRLDVPSVFLYAGSILPGRHAGATSRSRTSSRRSAPAAAARSTTPSSTRSSGRPARPRGLRGMFTANTMASAIEAMGWRCSDRPRHPPPTPAVTSSPEARARPWSRCSSRACPPAASSPARRSRTPSRWSWPSAGRPTRCCTCWRSPARPRSSLAIDDFDRIGRRVPHVADTKPAGRYVMTDLDRIGGVPVVLKELLDAGLLHGDA
jgi:dihydroxy-acid dehydratase